MIGIRWDPDAREELFEAAAWYDSRRPGRGATFRRRVESAVELVRRRPLAGPVLEDEFRHVIVPRFPYSLIYVPEPGEIRIVAVMHHRRHPDTWRERL